MSYCRGVCLETLGNKGRLRPVNSQIRSSLVVRKGSLEPFEQFRIPVSTLVPKILPIQLSVKALHRPAEIEHGISGVDTLPLSVRGHGRVCETFWAAIS